MKRSNKNSRIRVTLNAVETVENHRFDTENPVVDENGRKRLPLIVTESVEVIATTTAIHCGGPVGKKTLDRYKKEFIERHLNGNTSGVEIKTVLEKVA